MLLTKLIEQNSLVKALSAINDLHKIELPNVLSEISACLNDKNYAQRKGVTVKPHYFAALQGELIRRVKAAELDVTEQASVASILTVLSADKYSEICLSPNFYCVLNISDTHKFWANDDTSTIVQYYNHNVTSLQYDSYLNYSSKKSEFILTRARMSQS